VHRKQYVIAADDCLFCACCFHNYNRLCFGLDSQLSALPMGFGEDSTLLHVFAWPYNGEVSAMHYNQGCCKHPVHYSTCSLSIILHLVAANAYETKMLSSYEDCAALWLASYLRPRFCSMAAPNCRALRWGQALQDKAAFVSCACSLTL
jgi:hypothetical protein